MSPVDEPSPGTAPVSVSGNSDPELGAAVLRRRGRVGVVHACGALVIAFSASMVSDVLELAGGDRSWASVVAVVSLLAACGWMMGLAWLHPLTLLRPSTRLSTGREITAYAVMAAAVIGVSTAGVWGIWPDWSAAFETLRAVIPLVLVARLAYARGGSLKDFGTPGEWRVWQDHVHRRWLLAFLAMYGALWLSSIALHLLSLLPGIHAGPSAAHVDGGLVEWVMVIRSGPVEELVSVAAVVAALEYGKRPTWAIYTATITARVAFHLYYGFPAALGAVILAAVSTWAFRRWRVITPLIAMHFMWDATLTVMMLLRR